MGLATPNFKFSIDRFENIYHVFERIIQFCKVEMDSELRNNVLNGFLNYVVLFMKNSPLSVGQVGYIT